MDNAIFFKKNSNKNLFKSKIHCRFDNMNVAITKISPNGQIVIPSKIRKEMGLIAQEKFLVINEGDNIWLKRLNKENLKNDLKILLEDFQKEFKKHSIRKEDVLKEIQSYRKEKR